MEFALVLFIFPILILIASIIGRMFTRRWYVIPLIVFMVFTILTITVFNESFFIWVVVYTILSLIISGVIGLIKR